MRKIVAAYKMIDGQWVAQKQFKRWFIAAIAINAFAFAFDIFAAVVNAKAGNVPYAMGLSFLAGLNLSIAIFVMHLFNSAIGETRHD